MGLFDWLRRRGKGAAPPGDAQGDDPADPLREEARLQVAGGFRSRQEIEEWLGEIAEDEGLGVGRQAIARIVESAAADQRRAQRDWPETTDCDRLDAAFAELERAGILARQDFTCCGTCGVAGIADEIERARDHGRPVRGCAFYHRQDTESAVAGYGLCLNYGAVEDGEGPAVEVASHVVDALQRHGLQTKWDGSWERRIEVPLEWRRRCAL